MSVGGDLKSTLDAYGGLSALVSSRNYAVSLPQSPTYPNVVFTRISTTPSTILEGRSLTTNFRYQFDCRATTQAGARSVADQVIAALDAAAFTAVLVDDQDFPYEQDINSFRIVLDFSIWHTV